MPKPPQRAFENAESGDAILGGHEKDVESNLDGETKNFEPNLAEKWHPAKKHYEMDINLTQQYTKALQMRVEGRTYAQIAEECGFNNPARAAYAVKYMLKAAAREPTLGVLRLELARLDAMLEAWWPFAVTQEIVDTESGAKARQMPDPQAAAVVLKLFERRDRLYGFDKALPAAKIEPEEAEDKETAGDKPVESLPEPRRIDRIAEILETARARRDRQDSG